MCFLRNNPPPPMRKSVYKDILDFLIKVSEVTPKGNHLRRLHLLASLVHGCVKSKNCTLESLSQPCESYSASKKNSLLQQRHAPRRAFVGMKNKSMYCKTLVTKILNWRE